jgi:P27 family predicted phage terminase small subunit
LAAKGVAKRSPTGLGIAGKCLWKSIIGDVPKGYELDSRELHLLSKACRCADELAALEAVVDKDGVVVTGSRGQATAHPALVEARQLRGVQLRLLRELHLDPPAEESAGVRAARRAAAARWDRTRQTTATKGGSPK